MEYRQLSLHYILWLLPSLATLSLYFVQRPLYSAELTVIHLLIVSYLSYTLSLPSLFACPEMLHVGVFWELSDLLVDML